MKYYLFIDESGDHGLTTINPEFPVFLLCGILMSAAAYEATRAQMNTLKLSIWQSKEVIFHSRDIRKQEKEFVRLFDLGLKQQFYEGINAIMQAGEYNIIASAIRKDEYIKQYGKLTDDVYELSLSFIVERAIFCLDSIPGDKEVEVWIEKRGAREDKKLDEHFQRLQSRGTGYVSAERLKDAGLCIHFKSKRQNINGLQLADLIAYPTARFVLEPSRVNPAFEVFQSKFYQKDGKRYGLKVFP